jgi:hypothetical protein
MQKTSMRYWYPRIQGLGIPQPETVIIPNKNDTDLTALLEESGGDFMTEGQLRTHMDIPAIGGACDRFGYPVFLRSDFTSDKHHWKESCFIERRADIIPHISNILEFSILADIFGGIPFTAVAVRRYIKMAEMFKAFHEMPINPEFRIFIKDGINLCAHWYWPDDAIERPSIRTFKDRMFKGRHKAVEDGGLKRIVGYARKVGQVFKECWSVDLCLGADGTWYLIDMAEGFKSWHPEYCPNHATVKCVPSGVEI